MALRKGSSWEATASLLGEVITINLSPARSLTEEACHEVHLRPRTHHRFRRRNPSCPDRMYGGNSHSYGDPNPGTYVNSGADTNTNGDPRAHSHAHLDFCASHASPTSNPYLNLGATTNLNPVANTSPNS